jgi:hypothetical protein
MKNCLTILDVRLQRRGDRFLVKTTNLIAELEVAHPTRGVVLIATNRRQHRWHKQVVGVFQVGDNFYGEPVVTIQRMKSRPTR